ncbi:uncharacterized protein TRIADDRAFT_20386 [Trichoplax adhaerens]|uniref:FYVE-type domain-containing protein n=1 Tax=Trichoplax adhaerens TaxID=10228 RepID=B3RIK9_TRIAD|nr:hypothetical protein TRIADDRAFT_20386 [Trichoplax adhaerens]EDV29002.1 hypothetical protein TRIADDRAFT_20386 [Trichoplax adhaerens]|eukprot:XP_002108204.1 hypothetical protein TRIADDRAFT_20386 [Trichoplax adhaerens]
MQLSCSLCFHRCIANDDEIQLLRKKAGELKEKLDEAESAMVELSRVNQSLQVTHIRNQSRRWTPDKDALECSNCSRQFSVVIRRHHCRKCGYEVFCAECSAKQASTPFSRKPVRVCDACYKDLTG